MFDSREPQRVQFLPLVVCGLSHLPQLPLQAAVAFQPLPVVAVELHKLVVLGGQRFIGLAQRDLQLLHLMLVTALLLLALVFDRGAVVLQRLASVLVLLFQRLGMRLVFRYARGQASDAFAELRDRWPNRDRAVLRVSRLLVRLESAQKRGLGSLQQLPEATGLDDLAAFQHDDPFAELGDFRRIVRD